MRLIFADKSARDEQHANTSERLVNLYPVPNAQGGRAAFSLRGVPGTRGFTTVQGPFLRAMGVVENTLYVIAAGGLHKLEATGSQSRIGSVSDDLNTSIVPARGDIAMCAGGAYVLFDGSSLTQPGSGRLTTIGSVAFANDYVVMAEKNGREIEWTEVGDPSDRNALNFATAGGRDDRIVRLMAVGSYLWVMKETSYEVWGIAGTGTSAWARLPGAVRERGLKAHNLVCNVPDGIFFVGNDDVAYIGGGIDARPVSTPPVDKALADGEPTHCFYYEDKGARFCAIRFADRPAWVYDAAMGRWHERAEGVDLGAWGVITSAQVYGRWHVGDRGGAVMRFGSGAFDNTGFLKRVATSRTLRTGERFVASLLEVEGSYGRHEVEEDAPNWLRTSYGLPLTGSDGSPLRAHDPYVRAQWQRQAEIMLRTSRDGGVTWGPPRKRSAGRKGEYEITTRFRALGQFRQMTAELSITDPVDLEFLSEANLE